MKSRLAIITLLALYIACIPDAHAGVCDKVGRRSCIDVDGDGRCRGEDLPLPRPRRFVDTGELMTEYKVPSTSAVGKGNLLIGSRVTYAADSITFSAPGKVVLCRTPRRSTTKRVGSLDVVVLLSTKNDIFVGKDIHLANETGLLATAGRDLRIADGVTVNANNDGYTPLQAARNIFIGQNVLLSSSYLEIHARIVSIGSGTILHALPLGDGYSPAHSGSGFLNIQTFGAFFAESVDLQGSLVMITGLNESPISILDSHISGYVSPGEPPAAELSISGTLELPNTNIDFDSFATVHLPS